MRRRHPAHVLVVDDDPVCAEFCVQVLADRGYRVKLARCAADARALALDWPPDAVLCDLGLPDPEELQGLLADCAATAADRLAPAGARSHAVPILMSADREKLFRHEPIPGEPAGSPRLCKPFSPRTLAAAVGSAVAKTDDDAQAFRAIHANLKSLFTARLEMELADLDRRIRDREWHAVASVLHRLQGGAAFCGLEGFAVACARLGDVCGSDGPGPGWGRRYLRLVRLGRALATASTDATRCE